MLHPKVQAVENAHERLEMATDALYAAIESSTNFREGFYSLKVLADLTKSLNKGHYTANATSAEEALDLLLQHLDSMASTVLAQIERIEK